MRISETEIDRVFHALSAATRRDILSYIMNQEQSVSNIARRYDISFAAVQKHVSVLEEAQLIVKRAAGRERLVRANPAMITKTKALLEHYEKLWLDRVARLDELLAEESPPGPANS